MNEKEKLWIRRFYFGPGTLIVDKTGNLLTKNLSKSKKL